MSTRFQSTRSNHSYLARIAEEWNTPTVLTPDITTERVPAAPPAPVLRRDDLAARDALVGESVLEARHPEVARAVMLMWGHPELNEYFERLWLADGNLGPLDPDAMSELMLLARIHQGLVPHRPGRSLAAMYGPKHDPDKHPRRSDPWRDVPPRR